VISFRKLYPGILFPGTTQLDASSLKLDPNALATLNALNPLTWLRAFRQVRAFAPDAIVFQWWQPFFGPMVGVLARLLKRSGFKCIIECHNVISHEGGPLDRLLASFALSAADHLITHSSKDRKDLLAIVSGKRVSVSSLPSLTEFSSRTAADRNGRTILFFGNVRKYKGLDILLAAMPRVLQHIDCELIIVGEFYEPVEKYQAVIREQRIESHVHIDNRYVANEEVQQILEQADVLVLPYLSATQSAVARIALSNGLPLIASNTGGLAETVVNNVNGLLFLAGDPDALADQILNYFTNGLGPIFAGNILATSGSDSECRIVEIIREVAEIK
jgi:glycosyltransferase involved in cell wall biosynthesis